MKKNKKGFTLIELMVAVLITVVVIISSLFCYIQLMLLAEASVNLTLAVNDAQLVLEQLKATAYADIGSYVLPTTIQFPDGTNVNVLQNLPEETITLTRSVTGDLATISVNVSWVERGQARSHVLYTCINK